MIRVEIHTRPLILAKLAGQTECPQEVDVWLFLGDQYDCGQVILETVVSTTTEAEHMINDLMLAFKQPTLLREDKDPIQY